MSRSDIKSFYRTPLCAIEFDPMTGMSAREKRRYAIQFEFDEPPYFDRG